jgi:hypothetical protein
MELNLNSLEFLKDLPDSKITEKTFSGKRFERYIAKTKEAIFNEYICKVYKRQVVHAIVLKSYSDGYKAKTFTDFVIALFQSYHHPLMEKFENKDHVMHNIFRTYSCPNPDIEIDKKFLQTYIINAFEGDNCFANMVEEEIKLSCMKLIIMKSEFNADIDDVNYFVTIPRTLDECALFFHDLINGIQLSLEHLFASNTAKAIHDFVSNQSTNEMFEDLDKMKSDINLLNNVIDDKEKLIEKLNRQIKSLENKLKEQSEHKHKKYIEILEHNIHLNRQNQKLKEKYIKLVNKKYSGVEETNIPDDINELNELDINGKYLFIGFDKNGFQEQVLKHLPNAKFQDTNIDIHPSTDMVIMLTKHITHPTCFGIKEQCKNKGIPLIYSKYSNIGLIKDLMWNNMN